MLVSDVRDILGCEIFTREDHLDSVVQYGCASDLMSDVLAFSRSGAILLTGLMNIQTIHTAVIADLRAVVFVRGKKPVQDMVDLAGKNKIPLLATPYSMYEACGLLYREGLISTMECPAKKSAGTRV